MQPATYQRGEVAARAKTLYEKLRARVEPGNTGKYLVLDIETGDYEIDADHFAASKRAYEKNPNGTRFALRIGYPAMGRIGFNLRTERS